MEAEKRKQIVEAALLAAGTPLSVDKLARLFPDEDLPVSRAAIREVLEALEQECAGRGYELKRVASGYRYQARQELQEWLSRLWEEKPPRYSRALLETLALIAYRQPITRAEIEEVRGVTVSTNIIRTLQEREWVCVLGHRDVPGRPALYGSTRQFLDYFNLESLDELPSLAELADLDAMQEALELEGVQIDEGETDRAEEQPPKQPSEDTAAEDTDLQMASVTPLQVSVKHH